MKAAQLAYVMDEWLKEAVEDIEQEKALKDVAAATVKEKVKVAKVVEKKVHASEKARALAEKS